MFLAGPPAIDAEFRSQRAGLIEVMACGAALAVRSTTDLEHRVDFARGHGASTAHISAAIAIARAVCTGAQEEVDKVVRRAGVDLQPKPAQPAQTSCCETPSAADTAPQTGCNCNGECT